LDETLARLRRLLAMVFGMAIVVSGGVLSAVVAHSTRPLRRLAGDIDSIRADDLSLRVVADSVPSELRPVVDRLNELLARLDRAFARERAFTADVAHELRTPIAGLHTTLEVCRSRPRSTADYETAIDKCLRMSEGIGSMIRTLLLMGRADAGQLVADRSDVELVALLEGCWAPFAHRATAKSAVVECDIKTVRLETDVEKLKMLVNNLLDNAVSYVDEAGRIEIAGKLDGPSVVISISNTGSTIAPDQIPLLTERFWRGDSSRSATGLHCGLGLTLCDRLVGLIGGRLAFSSINGVFTAVVRLTQPGAAGNHDGPNLVGETRSPVHTA
jgi:signal transduction histidine kinase